MTGLRPIRRSQELGFAEWLRLNEHDRVVSAVAGMRAIGTLNVRTHLSWAEYHQPGGQEWYDWLIPTLGRAFDLLPCIHYTPPSISRTGRTSGAPRRLKDYADFVDHVLSRYGDHFCHVELWNEPNNLLDWDWRHDQDWLLFCEMVGGAAHWVEHRGWKAVLGGPSPFDPHWFRLMGERGLLGTVSAVGFHGFPGTWDSETDAWRGYAEHLSEMRTLLDRYNPRAQIWMTEVGYSTWRGDETEQVERFRQALVAPADRLYWYGWQDIPRTVAVQEGLYFDPRHYHLGITDADGRPKLLRRLLEAGGISALQSSPAVTIAAIARPIEPIVVIGGAGFIGTNLVQQLLDDGEEVVVFDNLSRPGVERNLDFLKDSFGRRLHTVLADVRDTAAVEDTVTNAKAVFHLAGQVAVTSSLADPRQDFAINAQGTLTILDALRRLSPDTPLIFASTNKVYGALTDLRIEEFDGHYLPLDETLRQFGIDETRKLDFRTPYGCSKGAADQYVLDYAHSLGLKTAVLRMSCIYGPHQFGTEDQGWVAHFLMRVFRGETITIYGDGKQVRDILHVNDAIAAYRAALGAIDRISGRAFNLGGGPCNAVNLRAVLDEIATVTGRKAAHSRESWRTGDQLYFVADTRRLTEAVLWRAKIGWREGLRDLADWVRAELIPSDAREVCTQAARTRMRVALVNPPWSFEGSIYFGCRHPHLPLELAYAKAHLECAGHEALMLDGHLFWRSNEDLVAEVQHFGADMTVVTTAPTYLFWRCAPPELRVPASFLQALGSCGGKTLAVGPHGSVTPAITLRKLGVDAVVRGECEDVITALAASDDWSRETSIAYFDGSGCRINGAPAATTFETLPAISWPDGWIKQHSHHHHRFDDTPYGPGAEAEASRGCPYTCSFCAKNDYRDKYRRRQLAIVLDEIDQLVAQGVTYIYFIDEIFLPQRPLLEALAQRQIKFGVQTRIDLWKPDLLALLGKAGCVSIEAGIESLTAEGREALAKRCTFDTEGLAQLLFTARRHVPFVQANLIGMEQDNQELVVYWRDRLINGGVWANKPVPLYPYPSSPAYRTLWGEPDDSAWERAHEHYLAAFTAFSDIQEARPASLAQLEAQCCRTR